VGFAEHDEAWLDLTVGRVKLAGRVLPWVATGVLSVGGKRMRLGGLGHRPTVTETPQALSLTVGCGRSDELLLRADSPEEQTVVWRYADPDGSEHHVANCSACSLSLEFSGAEPLRLSTHFGGTYELGMREQTHGLTVQPFSDP
jgi:hypothetical protein